MIRILTGAIGLAIMAAGWSLARAADPTATDNPLVIAWGLFLGFVVGFSIPSGRRP